MNDIGSLSSYGQAVQAAPPNEYVTAAQLWAEAKSRLERTGNAQYEAEQAHAKAKADEADAWNRLQCAAGRAEPKAAIGLNAMLPQGLKYYPHLDQTIGTATR